ncbi:hypothetical protein KBD09_01835 [Candidatus Woesebacteria bacterium]|nr:hypothetical protein [Candidatus Woesebacteria bacterium]
MISSQEFKKYFDFAYSAYQENNITDQSMRQEGKVPYIFHPLWAAISLMTDTQIPYEEREKGFKILILHDVLEDTSLELPSWVPQDIQQGVEELTFKDWDDAKQAIPSKSTFIKLLLLYDSLSSMYELHVSERKKHWWKEKVISLTNEVQAHYGNIRAVQMGKAISENTDW